MSTNADTLWTLGLPVIVAVFVIVLTVTLRVLPDMGFA
jgi:hypothetical protein